MALGHSMRKRLIYGSGILLLAVLIALVVWEGSFTFGAYGPASPEQTFLFWAVSILIFILTVTLAFMLIRTALKLYVERHSNHEGSRLKTKMVVGALALSVTPVFFLAFFNYSLLGYNLNKWFSRPAEKINLNLAEISRALERETQDEVRAQARWIGALPQTRLALMTGAADQDWFGRLCAENDIVFASISRDDGRRILLCQAPENGVKTSDASILLAPQGGMQGALTVRNRMASDLAAREREILQAIAEYDRLVVYRKEVRSNYLLLLFLITLFTLFLAVWVALFLARQISVPISALLAAAQEVRRGNLGYRIETPAMDELANLVRAFNEMTQDLDANSRELERRRRFTETILESIPTGVISLTADGLIQRGNRALRGIFSDEQVSQATCLSDLFSPEDTAEIRYLMNRARRTGVAASQFDLNNGQQMMHLSATVAALEDRTNSGFVLVLEDTSELLRAQKAAAWQEVARRVAHEIKNPLTPIALSAERIIRQLDRSSLTPEVVRILRECSLTISQEVETLKSLVNEFSRFSRFPSAQPAAADLNEVVENALSLFQGRLDGVTLDTQLAAGLPPVWLDREQFKRVVINLIDNAAEAMQHALVKRLYIATSLVTPDSVELVVADSGCGISREDKEKLFLPYFSTKSRGTGLGLAIVQHILAEHHAMIRVEDNRPTGARFIIEIPVLATVPSEPRAVESSV